MSGTLPRELYPVIRPFFREQYHASPYMEKYVLQALCEMGFHQDAIDRMKHRYKAMIESSLTTLWEGWGIGPEGFGGGSYNHAWSGGPLTILCQYIAGVEAVEPGFATFRVTPHPASLSRIRMTVPLSGEREIRYTLKKDARGCRVTLVVPPGTEALFCRPEPYTRMRVNGKECRSPEKRLPPGKWRIRLQ